MSLWDQSLLAGDADFIARVTACVSSQPYDVDPPQWANANRWALSAAPGFADAYASALAGDVPDPGRDQAVISDPQILSAVQNLLDDE